MTGELHPQTLSEVVRVGYLAALTIGRDAEIRSAGHRLGDVPAWCRAGPATVIAIVCGMLRDGIEVDLNTGTVTERGPMLSVADHDVGQGAATYTFDGVTFDESVWMAEQLSHDLVHDCIGNPMRRLMAAFPDDDAVIQSCEHEGVGTGFDLVSPIVRLAPAPVGYEQDPVQAWLSLAADFDEAQVYGPRLYGPATKEDQD